MRDALSAIGVPPKYRDAELEHVKESVRERVSEYVVSLSAHVQRGEGLVVAGPVGVGKTSVAALIAQESVKRTMPDRWGDHRAMTCRWHYVPDLADPLSERTMRGELIAACTWPDLVVLDDLMPDRMTTFQLASLERIVERRYRTGKPLVITTNLTPADLRQSPEMDRIVDRLMERGFGMQITGESMRRTWRDGEAT